MNIKLFSFFSGAGFLDLGFEYSGYEVEFVNEYSTAFLNAYQYSRNILNMKKPKYGYYNCDINDFLKGNKKKELTNYVDCEKKESVVGFIGGPPCPDFSVAGKNHGINGNNGRLTNSYKRIILEQLPDFFIFENVKGLFATKKHREEYEKIKLSFIRKGYLLTEKLVNSLEYGVPQERERIILFGIHKSICRDSKVTKKIMKDNFKWGEKEAYKIQHIKELHWPDQNDYIENSKVHIPSGIIRELTIEYWFNKNDVEHHANSLDFFMPRQGKSKIETISEGDVSKKSYKRLHRWRYSPTVAYGNNEVHLHPYKSRRISVAEALALQSMPKEYVIDPSLTLTDKFKTVGNGVPFLMAKGISEQIYYFLNDNIDKEKVKDRCK